VPQPAHAPDAATRRQDRAIFQASIIDNGISIYQAARVMGNPLARSSLLRPISRSYYVLLHSKYQTCTIHIIRANEAVVQNLPDIDASILCQTALLSSRLPDTILTAPLS
jgi:hypothetical protein